MNSSPLFLHLEPYSSTVSANLPVQSCLLPSDACHAAPVYHTIFDRGPHPITSAPASLTPQSKVVPPSHAKKKKGKNSALATFYRVKMADYRGLKALV